MIRANSRRTGLNDSNPQAATVTLGGEPVVCLRGRLGTHLKLGALLDKLQDQIEDLDSEAASKTLHTYVEVATGQTHDALGFREAGTAVAVLSEFNRLRFYPPFMEGEQPTQTPQPWEYEGRRVAVWVHMIGKTYGWSRAEILELEPEDAAVYIQEIMLGEQFEKEWEYGISGAGNRFDKRTGKGHFVPLTRPHWMVEHKLPSPVKLPASMLPVGRIIDLGGGGAPGATEVVEAPKARN